ncbi:MAG TPA: DUF1214 domain-containing protein, partial [Mycobacterium sp.]|nr:DUF1214 domain-containing protein [Mycobacterium sp.]
MPSDGSGKRGQTRSIARRGSTLLIAALCATACAAGVAFGSDGTARAAVAAGKTYSTTLQYVIRFYPRFMTYFQQTYGKTGINALTGPARVNQKYGLVVAINVDTIYAEDFVDLAAGPQVLTVPKTNDHYSLLTLDMFGNVFQTNVTSAGTYALVPKGYAGTLPSGLTKVTVPYRFTTWIFRADRYAPDGTNMVRQARAFRRGLRATSLAKWEADHAAGRPRILPVALYGPQMKAIADEAIANQPTGYLRELQAALRSPTTQPLSPSDRRLSRAFDRVFQRANAAAARGSYQMLSQIIAATRDAHAMIINRWQTHIGPTRWVHFGNIGEWGHAYLDRAALSEYIQFGNNAAAAQYYNAFTNRNGTPLDGSIAPERITFPANNLPQASRFWSLTAYIPPGATLYPNRNNKFVVARYTPGLKTNRNGSITIYIRHTRPRFAPKANWLPVPNGPYSLLLRIYGPEGNTAPGAHYAPPEIRPFGLPGGSTSFLT